jgi:hypothetical protein
VHFVDHHEANALMNDLNDHPHAFVLACLVDRQIRAELAWMVPYEFSQRVGSFDFEILASLTADQVRGLFLEPNPLHRFPDKMSNVFFKGVQRIHGNYAGDASRIWNDQPSSAALIRRFLEFYGAGPKISSMAANILVRDFNIRVKEKYDLDISADVQVVRVFTRLGLVSEGSSPDEVIYRARELNRPYPGIFDLACWDIGRNWCRPRAPKCHECFMGDLCPSAGTLV